MTCGPYRPITLTSFAARIKGLHPRSSVSFNKATNTFLPLLKLDIALDGLPGPGLVQGLDITLKDSAGAVIKADRLDFHEDNRTTFIVDAVVWKLGSEGVKLWWPVGYGEQNLYDVQVDLLDLVRMHLLRLRS